MLRCLLFELYMPVLLHTLKAGYMKGKFLSEYTYFVALVWVFLIIN